MKVLVLSHMYPRPGRPHYGIFVQESLRVMTARGHEVEVIAPIPRTPPGLARLRPSWHKLASLPPQREVEGILLHHPRYLLLPRRLDIAGGVKRLSQAVLRLASQPRFAGFDIIHAHTVQPDGVAASRLAPRLGLPFLVTSHGSDVLRDAGWTARGLGDVHDASRAAARLIFPSRAARDRAADKGLPIDRSSILWNGFEMARFLAAAPPDARAGELRLICVANLIESKGISPLLEAIARLRGEGIRMHLRVVGTGPDEARVHRHAAELQLEVDWTPRLNREDLAAALRQADVFTLPAWEEAFGIVYLEAMASGLPIVACAGEGIADVITDGREGFLLPPREVEGLAMALRRLAHDPALRRRLGAAGIARVKDLGWDAHAAKLEALYKEVLDEARASDAPGTAAPTRGRVMHFLYNSEPDRNGYALRSRYILLNQRRQHWQVQACTSPFQMARWGKGPRESREGILYHRLRLPGAESRRGRLGWRRWLVILQKAFLPTLLTAQATRILRRERPDVIHAHSPAFNLFLARRAARRAGLGHLPLIYEVRGLTEESEILVGNVRAGGWFYRGKRRLEERAMLAAGCVATLSEALREDFIARGVPADRIRVLPNGVDVEAIPMSEWDEGLARDLGLTAGKTIGYLGTLGRLEGLPWLVDRLAELPADWRLLIVGWGWHRQEILDRARELGLSERLVAPGAVPHAEVGRWYGLMDYFVLPRLSHRVTERVAPLKPLEAMAAGRIVLASDVGGHREILREGVNGFLFRREDPAAFCQLILELSTDAARRRELGQAARRWVERERSWADLVRGYEDIYDEARKT